MSDWKQAEERADRAEAENRRLRRWLEYAAENMTYPGVQQMLEEALSDAAPSVSDVTP